MTRLLAALAIVAALTGSAVGHPGRLDAEGCHTVRKPGGFLYKSGVVAPQGQYHCHRALVGKPMILDGREVLGESGDQDGDEDDDRVPQRPAEAR